MVHQSTFGELLLHSRRMAGLTQGALAARSGVSARAISDLERGVKHSPRPATVQLLVTALRLSAQERALFEVAASAASDHPPDTVGDTGHSAGTPPGCHALDGSRAGGSADVPPLVGRTGEQAIMERHLRGEGPPVLIVAGEPGIGKTRLLREAVDRAAAHGLHVVQGRGQRPGAHSLGPVLDALREHIGSRSPVHLRADLAGCAWLVRALPELADGPIEPLPATPVPPEQEQHLVAAAVARFLANVAGPAGTLLVLDDLHYADAPAVALLAALMRSTLATPLRLIGAYRDTEICRGDPLCALLADLARDRLVAHLPLLPLTMGDAAELLGMLLGDAVEAGVGGHQQVLEWTGGVPFYLLAWAEHQCLKRGMTVLDQVPWAVRQSVYQRIDALPPAAQAVLETLAVAGGRATYQLLVAAAACPSTEVLTVLEAACQGRILEQDGDAYRFVYGAVRATIEADLSAARRALLHQHLRHAMPHQPRYEPGRGAISDTDLRSVVPPGARPLGADARLSARDVQGQALLEERAYHLSVLFRHHVKRSGMSVRYDGG